MWLCKCDLFRLGYRRNENNVIPPHLSRVTRKGVSEISLHILYALCKLKFYVKPVRGGVGGREGGGGVLCACVCDISLATDERQS